MNTVRQSIASILDFYSMYLAICNALRGATLTLHVKTNIGPLFKRNLPWRWNRSMSTTTKDHVEVLSRTRSLPRDQRYWCSTSGRLLELLLDNASYSKQAQASILSFFERQIVPYLGPARDHVEGRSVDSFMTDDGGPIELSWDWGTPSSTPRIRFSMEPMSLPRGPSAFSSSGDAAKRFHDEVIKNTRNAHFDWFDHLYSYLVLTTPLDVAVEDHMSQIFYAFDLDEEEVMAKTYFVPGFLANALGKDTWAVLNDVISSASQCLPENLKAMRVLNEVFTELGADLRMEMMAIDLLQPKQSRFKIYFRSRDTDFATVARIMTLNGRLNDASIPKGIEKLRQLWKDLFGVQDGEKLPHISHRTAGVLYYVDFRLGDDLPSIKIYIPVKHYASNDWSVLQTLGKTMTDAGYKDSVRKYEAVLSEAFSREALEAGRGVHSYIGCAIRADGSLKLISYLNPQVEKLRFRNEYIDWSEDFTAK